MKILAVDDDAFILELIPLISAKAGFSDVTTVVAGELALAVLDTSDRVFDCLLLDIQMPGMDGIELCRRVRAMPTYNKTPIIMLTAMTEKDYIDRAFQAGASDYAAKPFNIIELGARLRMAQELVSARQAVAAATKEHPVTAAQGHSVDLGDPLPIEGVDGLVDYAALGNYLAQFSPSGQAGMQVMAVKMDRVEAIYDQASSKEFFYALTEVAGAIGDVLSASGGLMSYAGNGVFVIIFSVASLIASGEMEAEIQSLLDDRNSEYDNGAPLDIEVSLGNPIRPSTSKTHGIRQTFERAIARAESRFRKKQSAPRPLGVRLLRG